MYKLYVCMHVFPRTSILTGVLCYPFIMDLVRIHMITYTCVYMFAVHRRTHMRVYISTYTYVYMYTLVYDKDYLYVMDFVCIYKHIHIHVEFVHVYIYVYK